VGLVHDILGVADEDRGVAPALRVRFVEKVFVKEIDALLELDHGRSAGEEEGEE